MGEFLNRQAEAGVITLTMNRPEDRNALSGDDQFAEFVAASDAINRDPTAKVVILTGAGPAFCSGGNIKHLRQLAEQETPNRFELRAHYRFGIQRVTEAMYALEVPTIAAVNGPAIGAGCDLACTCDIRIAAEGARFAESFVKLGIISGDGGSWLLPKIVGHSHASELAFTGDPIDAARALEIGLVSQVVSQDELLDSARTLAGRIASQSAPALRLTKRLLREGARTDLSTLLELSAAYQAIAHCTDDYKQAIEEFFAGREKKK
jgi:enoyl-CoA hydratase/carnithine racemase